MRMHEIIDIVEAQGSEAVGYEAYDLISGYVTHGSMRTPDEFDEWFERLMQMLPRPKAAALLYRVLKITPEQARAIQADGLLLEPRRFSSWTKSIHALDRLAFDRHGSETQVAVIRATVPAANIVVDVAAFYRRHGFASPDYDEWLRYVKPEQEVIVRETGEKGLLVTTDMLLAAPELGTGLDVDKTPVAGDAFRATNGDAEKVQSVAPANEQPGGAVYMVYTLFGDRAFVRRNRRTGRWVEVDR